MFVISKTWTFFKELSEHQCNINNPITCLSNVFANNAVQLKINWIYLKHFWHLQSNSNASLQCKLKAQEIDYSANWIYQIDIIN